MPFSIILYRTALAGLLCFIGGFASAKQLNDYPFTVETKKIANGYRIMAHNAGPASVSVKLFLTESLNVKMDRPFPVYAVVPPGGGTLFLGVIRPEIQRLNYRFRTQYTWRLGDMNASQSPDALYRMPFRDGTTHRIGQAPGGPITTHLEPHSEYAVDISMPEGTPVLAARAGTVIYTEASQVYGGKAPDMRDKANEVRIQHVDGTIGAYAHFAHGGVYVYAGQRVEAGQQIGLAGSTGYSSGPHLHFAVQTVRRNSEALESVSLPFQFYVGNPPVSFFPQYGQIVTANYVVTARQNENGIVAAPVETRATGSSVPASDVIATVGDVTISVNPWARGIYERLKQLTTQTNGFVWVGVVVGLLTLFLYRSRVAAKRRQQASLFRTPF